MHVGAAPEGKRARVRLVPLYSCADMCGREGANPGERRLRRACRCSLPDFDPTARDPAADKVAARDAEWRASEIVGLAKAQGVNLDFELDRDGCPWGWTLSRYALSVSEYTGQRSADSPIRSQNPKLWRRAMRDAVEPTELFEAVALLEGHENGCFAQFHDAVNK